MKAATKPLIQCKINNQENFNAVSNHSNTATGNIGLPYNALHAETHLSHDNTGQVIIFPFYTVANDHNTYLNLTITTATPKILKVTATTQLAKYASLVQPTIQPPSGQSVVYRGLPVIGFSHSRFINSNAQPGILANYSTAQPFWSHRSITE